jgi:hypothetical protein
MVLAPGLSLSTHVSVTATLEDEILKTFCPRWIEVIPPYESTNEKSGWRQSSQRKDLEKIEICTISTPVPENGRIHLENAEGMAVGVGTAFRWTRVDEFSRSAQRTGGTARNPLSILF